MPIRAITFDFWRTLFRETESSRQRPRLRTDALVKATGVPEEDAKNAMKETTREFLRIHIVEQRTLLPEDALPMLEKALDITIAPAVGRELAQAFAQAILECPPEPIEDALEAVRAASERVPVGLISDTGISPGASLQKLLARHGILHHFKALTFSDVVGVAKPQAPIFADAIKQLEVQPEELLHIGDLEPTDIRGALDFGAQAALFGGDNDKFVGATQAHHTFTSWKDFIEALPDIT